MTDAEAPEMSAARPENYFDPQDVTGGDLDSLRLFVWRRDTVRRGSRREGETLWKADPFWSGGGGAEGGGGGAAAAIVSE